MVYGFNMQVFLDCYHNDGCETTVNPSFDIQEICIIGCELLL